MTHGEEYKYYERLFGFTKFRIKLIAFYFGIASRLCNASISEIFDKVRYVKIIQINLINCKFP